MLVEQGGKEQAWLLSEGRTASTDYFLFPHLERLGYRVKLLGQHVVMETELAGAVPALFVVSRYLPRAWIPVLEELARRGVKIIYFMDDDLFDWRALSGLPWRYRLKIVRLALLQQKRLRRLCSDVWVSTAYLAEKYAHLNPLVLEPMPLVQAPPLAPAGAGVRICYHGTASHALEIDWLKEVMAAVQSVLDTSWFEIFGSTAVKRQFASVPRVSVMHAMSWPDYLAWSGMEHRDIALAPLLSGRFNAARGPTKFFDYTRLGAAGIYSDVAPYQGYINDGVDGVLLENKPELWVEAILSLAQDAEKRNNMVAAARSRLESQVGNKP